MARQPGLIVDYFAGGGGASLGVEAAMQRAPDVAVNHDPVALAMYKANHPNTRLLCESVFDINPPDICEGRPVELAWFSPDCTHFSKARGGKPVKKAIRGLAWVVLRWAATVRPRVIIMENVEEFKTWGPLTRKRGRDKHPQPCKHRRYRTFRKWFNQLSDLGYTIDYRELVACDYGAPTIRKRMFLVARRDRCPVRWPTKTHGEGCDKPYRTAAECIDWNIPVNSIFGRKRPLAENTMKRIARGIKRFVIDAEEPFIVCCNHGGDWFRGQSLKEPFRTVTASRDAHGVVVPSIARIGQTGGNGGYVYDMEAPLTTVTSKAEHLLVSAFMAKHFGGMTGVELDTPAPTTTARGTQNQLVTSHLMQLKGNCKHGRPVTEPMPTVLAQATHVAEVRAFLIKYFGTGGSQSLNEPAHTLTAKHRLGLVTVHGVDYQIVDIGMRMLSPAELFTAQGFKVHGFRGNETGYIINPEIDGKPLSKTKQVACCGNSVSPPCAYALVRANMSRAPNPRAEEMICVE